MSIPSCFEHLARSRDDACRLAGRAATHEGDLERLAAVLPKPSTPDVVLATVRNVADL